MANTNAPFGLRPVRHRSGSPWNGQTKQYYVAASDPTALYIGDPVILSGSANAVESFGCPIGSLPSVIKATLGDGNLISGVVTAVAMVTAESTIYRAASTERVVFVCDDPDVIFEIQGDAGGSLDETSVGLNACLIAGTGSTYTGLSGVALDGGTTTAPAADVSQQLTILGLAKKQNNAVGDYAIWEVLINQHTFNLPALGI